MSHVTRVGRIFVVSLAALAVLMLGTQSSAQVYPNPYKVLYGWEKLPAGRTLGVIAGVFVDPDGKHLWMLDRCSADGCAGGAYALQNATGGADLDPVLKFDLDGNLVKSFGKGIFGWPHGFFVDHEGNVWVTDGAPAGEGRGDAGHAKGIGHKVVKFSPEGKVLMTLGVDGVAGDDQTHFNGPSHASVHPMTGDIWVTDGHRGGNNRLVRFSKDGKFKMQIGGGIKSATAEKGLFNDPHHIAYDSQGRLFVSDRGNNRIQILDQEGKFIAVWTHWGRPSSIFINRQDDRMYVVDGTSSIVGADRPGYMGQGSVGYERGIRIGNAKTGWIDYMIPEIEIIINDRYGQLPEPLLRGVAVEFIGVDPQGNIYAGEVQGRRLAKYMRVRP